MINKEKQDAPIKMQSEPLRSNPQDSEDNSEELTYEQWFLKQWVCVDYDDSALTN